MKGERERKLVLFRVPFVNEMPLCARFDSLPDSWLKKSRRYPSPQSRDCSEEERKYGRNCTPEVLLLHPKKLFEFRAINLLLFNIVPRLDNDIYIYMFEERFPLMGENLSKFFGTKRIEEMERFSREVRTFSARRQKKEIDELSSQAESWPRADWDIYIRSSFEFASNEMTKRLYFVYV